MGAASLSAQQYGLYSQYIFNLYAINPAYAGARDALSVNGTYRAQWVGIEGAPRTSNFNIHSPLKSDQMALGLQFQQDQIGARNASFLGMSYAYRLRLDEAGDRKIAMALQAGVINYQFDWFALEYRNPDDPMAFSIDANFWIPNIDFGLMYLAPRGYIGVSAMGMQRSRLHTLSADDARLSTFVNAMAGHIFSLGQNTALKAHGLLRHELNGPVQAEAGLAAGLYDRLWIGALYRQQFGFVYHLQVMAAKGLVIGYAFDWATNGLKVGADGSHELYIGIDLFATPRIAHNMRFY